MQLKHIRTGETYLIPNFRSLAGSDPITHHPQVRVISKDKSDPRGSVLVQVTYLPALSWMIPRTLNGCKVGEERRLDHKNLEISKTDYQQRRRGYTARQQQHKQEGAALKREAGVLAEKLGLPPAQLSSQLSLPLDNSRESPKVVVSLTLNQADLARLLARLERIEVEPRSALSEFFPPEEERPYSVR